MESIPDLVRIERTLDSEVLRNQLGLVEEANVRSVQGARGRYMSRVALQGFVAGALVIAAVWPFARHYGMLTSGGPVEAAAGAAHVADYFVPPQNTLVGRWLVARGVQGPRGANSLPLQ